MENPKPAPQIQYPTPTQFTELDQALTRAGELCKALPRSREASIAATKIDEAVLWMERLHGLALN